MPLCRQLTRSNLLVQHCEAATLLLSQHVCPQTSCVRRFRSLASSLASTPVHAAHTEHHTIFTTEPNIDITSLENTLRAHREANRAPVVRKIYKKGESVRIHDPEIGLPAIEVKLPQKKAHKFKRVDLAPAKAISKGTSRDLDVLWRVGDGERKPPLQYRLPWLRHLDETDPRHHSSALERLAAEIRAFERYTSPSEEEQHAADSALEDIVRWVAESGDDLVVDVIGSRATNLADPLSDLDINVSIPKQWVASDKPMGEDPLEVLNRLNTALRKVPRPASQTSCLDIQYYLKQARVPILLCHHKLSGLPVQIQSTPLTYDSREYVKAALKEYPSLRGLFKVVKQSLQMRGLTIGSSGGITSYPLLQMVIVALKFSEARFHPSDVGNQFLFFLEFYSNIDFSMHGISTEPIELFSKSVGHSLGHDEASDMPDQPRLHEKASSRQSHPPFQRRSRQYSQRNKDYLMTLQDPTNPINDLGKTCYRIKDVQETFIALGATMKRAVAEWDRTSRTQGGAKQRPGPRSLLEHCIGGDYRIYEHERDDLRRLGSRSSEEGSIEALSKATAEA